VGGGEEFVGVEEVNTFRQIAAAFAFTALLTLGVPTAYGATVQADDNGRVYLEGPIEKGDFEKIRKAFVKADRSVWLDLNSPGGDLLEAVKIARLVRNAWIVTEVSNWRFVGSKQKELPKPVRCDSACAIIFIAGASRIYMVDDEKNGRPALGFHRAYLDSGTNSVLDATSSERAFDQGNDVFRGALAEFGAPLAFIEQVMRTRSDNLMLLGAAQFYDIFGESRTLGDGIPWLEEFFNARCGRRLSDQEYEWMDKHRDDPAGKQLLDRIYQRLSCVNRLNDQHQAELRKQLGATL
jgi:hypothetical protein